MEKKTIEQWINYGRKNCKNYVFYENMVLDLGDFMTEHPGGVKAIKNYIFKDITNILFQVFPHRRDTTIAKLTKYQVGMIPPQQAQKTKEKVDKSIINTDKNKQKKKVCFNNDHEEKSLPAKGSNITKTEPPKRQKQPQRQLYQSASKSKNSKMNKSKSKKKENVTSIRIINQDNPKPLDHYLKENQNMKNSSLLKGSKQMGLNTTCSFPINQIDEEKPNFKVPILMVKQMNKNN